MNTNTVKDEIVNLLLGTGAYDVRIADPRTGFEYSDKEKHPLSLMPECNSIIVFAVAMSPEMNNTYLGTYSPKRKHKLWLGPLPSYCESETHVMRRLNGLFLDSLNLRCSLFLYENGYRFNCHSGIQQKVAAYESGMGTWGKGGFILHPEFGNRISLGTVLTDAVLAADERREVSFCRECNECHRVCPAGAFGEEDGYHGNWDKQTCLERRKRIETKGGYCHNCFAACPSCHMDDDMILEKKYGRSIWK